MVFTDLATAQAGLVWVQRGGTLLAEECEGDVVGLNRLPPDHPIVLPDFVRENAVKLDVLFAVPSRTVVQPASREEKLQAAEAGLRRVCH